MRNDSRVPRRIVGGLKTKILFLIILISFGSIIISCLIQPSNRMLLAEGKTPQIPGMTFIGTNTQGYVEYRHKKTDMVFVLLPAGTFKMGSTESGSEKPIHQVAIDSFLISKYEVTQGVWQKIMNGNPSKFKKGNDHPVEQVNWNDCQEFCKKTGLRLPTEAEWEYACRSKTTTRFYWGNEPNSDYMWSRDNAGKTTHPAGQKKPNEFGLYDMSGNVWEWCQNWYDEKYYQNSPKKNPKGPASGNYRVVRGGSWYGHEWYCRSAARFKDCPGCRCDYRGFRCAASLK